KRFVGKRSKLTRMPVDGQLPVCRLGTNSDDIGLRAKSTGCTFNGARRLLRIEGSITKEDARFVFPRERVKGKDALDAAVIPPESQLAPSHEIAAAHPAATSGAARRCSDRDGAVAATG